MNATRTPLTVRPLAAPQDVERPAPAETRDVTLIPGDGVGPEVMGAAIHVLDAAGARVRWEIADAGGRALRRGAPALPGEAAESVLRTGVVLAGPMGMPPDAAGRVAGFPRMFDTHAGVLWVRGLPGAAAGPLGGRGVDLRVVRDTAGEASAPEPPRSADAARALERLARAAFELARADGCARVHCATRADLLLFAEGMMQRVFHETARAYPGVEAGHLRLDEVARMLVSEPGRFGVIVAAGSNGEVLEAVAAGLVGGAATLPRARLGDGVAVFEPAHGPMHALAGRGATNPTAAILAGVEMLRHLGQTDTADAVEQALFLALDAGVRTPDLPGHTVAVRTPVFAEAVVANLGRRMRRE